MGRFRIVVVVAALALGGCWAQNGGNAGRSGANPWETSFTTSNAAHVVPRWWTDRVAGAAVIANGFVIAADEQRIHAWSTATTSCVSPAPSQCHPDWSTPVADAVTEPVVDSGFVLTTARHGDRWYLEAYDAAGIQGCTPRPQSTCTARWSADLGVVAATGPTAPTVAGGWVFLSPPGATQDRILTFDVHGVDACDASTRMCAAQHLLQPSTPVTRPIAADDGRVFVPTDTGIEVFDLDATTPCTTSVCTPVARFPVTTPSAPSVAGGRLYTASGTTLESFDATLTTGCGTGGFPVTCTRTWRGPIFSTPTEPPVVAGGRVYVLTTEDASSTGTTVEVFDAAGVQSCNLSVHACTRMWRYTAGPEVLMARTIAASSDILFMATTELPMGAASNVPSHLLLFDATGTASCSGIPRTCTSLTSVDLGSAAYAVVNGRMAIAGGLVTVARSNTPLQALGLP